MEENFCESKLLDSEMKGSRKGYDSASIFVFLSERKESQSPLGGWAEADLRANPRKAAQDAIGKSSTEASIRTLGPLYLFSVGTRGLVVAGK